MIPVNSMTLELDQLLSLILELSTHCSYLFVQPVN